MSLIPIIMTLGKNGDYFDLTKPGIKVFDVEDSALTSLYFPVIRLASDFPVLTTTKKYILTYSTDHAIGNGAIAWGDMDNADLSDFQERGVILTNTYQPETISLFYNPNDTNGEPVYMYFHTYQFEPGNNGFQQTRLFTTAGGAELHNCVFTDRGRPLGIVNLEDHTGYMNLFEQSDGSVVFIHHTRHYYDATLDGINRFGKSVSNGQYGVTRITSRIDNTSFMPSGKAFHMSPPTFYNRNGKQYAFGMSLDYDYSVDSRRICVCQCENNDYIPTKFLANISSDDGGNKCKLPGFYLDDLNSDLLHVMYTTTTGVGYTDSGKELWHTTFDMRGLDNL